MDSELREDLARMRRANIKASEAMGEAGRMVIALKRDLLEAREEMERMDSCAQEADRLGKMLASTRARIRRLHTMYVEDREAAEEGTAVWKERSVAAEDIARLMGPDGVPNE